MLFRHEDIVQALAGGDIKDPQYFKAIYQKLVLDSPDGPDKQAALQTNGEGFNDYPEQFKLFLTEDLPSSESVPSLVAVWKIVYKLILFAAEVKVTIRDFYWWDILAKQRALVATLRREGYEFRVYFLWKKTNKDEVHPMHRGSQVRCSADSNSPGGLKLEFEAQAYQEMRKAYEDWLKAPLVLPVHFKPNKAEASLPINTLTTPASC
jgi:hypothetical protein